MQYSLLEHIESPADLKSLSIEDLKALSGELRQYIISTLSSHPGHLASGLGVVELTVALHAVFNTPDDKLVWDVGHQAYAHKILTGRRNRFSTIRTYGGLSGFPKMTESEYDAFGTGHSSTSISAALGMATASKLQGNASRQHIAVIGDGSMTGGEAFEALNNAGVSKANILVILNDNGISIDKSVGGLSRYLTKVTASRRYNDLKNKVWDTLDGDEQNRSRGKEKGLNFFQKMAYSTKSALLGHQNNLFESLGFRYFGPIDGHNMEDLLEVLNKLRKLKGPKLLHIVTTKGKGLPAAEENPTVFHAPGKFDAETGERIKTTASNMPPKYQDVFGRTIIELAEKNPKIVGITPAMPTGCSLNMMMAEMPDRAFDVGIAEQHAVTFAAGLAAQGQLPFCNIYSSFMQRAYDQVIHDVALQNLDFVLCLDRGGLVGDDGPTHHGAFDMACLRLVPNLTIMAPMNEHELRNMMYTAQLPGKGPVVIRYPRGNGVLTDWHNEMLELPIGKGRMLKEGREVAIVSIGHIGNSAMEAAATLEADGISVGVYDMRFVKPLDTALLDQIAERYDRVITLEDGCLEGGFGSAVLEYYSAKGGKTPAVKRLGIPDRFITHGTIPQLQQECGIDTTSIIAAVKA
ncbi:MAG: 1-deoxy-D-xylulose-5-phosphate synthase [Bacteroidales bacterium]|nr:1-deoxy-D-xylulose-5-phosphate synthase [Bacteroidales bacterium]